MVCARRRVQQAARPCFGSLRGRRTRAFGAKYSVMSPIFDLEVRNPSLLLEEVFHHFAGPGCLVSLEGDLSQVASKALAFSHAPTKILRRNTLEPEKDFIIFPVSAENLTPLIDTCRRAGIKDRILHIQVQKNDALVFASYDQFAFSCTWVAGSVSHSLLSQWQEAGLIKSYKEKS
jgi:hypothetical protein